VIAVDNDGSTVFVNQAACRMIGLPKAVVRQKFLNISAQHQDLLKHCQCLMEIALERREVIAQTCTIEGAQRFYFDLVATPLARHNGMILAIQDKTSDYEVVEMGKDFIANASHELRTPITIIRGFAETLHDLPNLSLPKRREITEKITKTSLRLNTLVKSLLTLADIEHLQDDQLQWSDMVVLAENCRQTLLLTHPTIHVAVHKSSENIPVWGDADLLTMAIMNLLENAVKYSPAPAVIDITVSNLQGVVRLNVKDHGIGIPESDLPRIFNRFYTVDKARSRKSGGTGLGLSIVKAIVSKHHGEISAVSRLGVGSDFTIYLPQVDEPAHQM
jgi:two-component system phosphate regulon sensor histidine kinase PhoR